MGKLKMMEIADAEKALRDTGLLWALNTLVLHPAGLALAFAYDDGDKEKPESEHKPIGVVVMRTDDGDSIEFVPSLIEEGRRKLGDFLIKRILANTSVSNEPTLAALAWPMPGLRPEPNPVKSAAINYLGDMVRQPMIVQMDKMKAERGDGILVKDIHSVEVPEWLFNALAALEEKDVPTILGCPLSVGTSDSVIVVFE